MKIITLLCFTLLAAYLTALSQPVGQWRGAERDGRYRETNLLKQWPENGPALQWSFEGLGAGHSSPVVSGERLYVTGIPDTIKGTGRLFAFDLAGKLIWTKDYGSDFVANFPGTRSTPTVAGDHVYIESGNGVLYCLSAKNGDEIWKVDFFSDLQADSVQFGFSESVLIDGDRLICTPGGKNNNVVALDRFTGKKIWASKGFEEQATYTSPALFHHNGRKIIVNLTASSILGIDGDTGEMLWRFHQYQDNKIHANTPQYHDGSVLISSASRKESSGLVQLVLSPDGRQAAIQWRNKEIINLMGGNIVNDGYIYMSAHLQPKWYCVDWKSGKIIHMAKEMGGGPVIYADGLFYCYAEKDGEMALVDFTPEKFSILSKFKVTMGTGEHWAHPVISHGLLLIRHGDALMAYRISA